MTSSSTTRTPYVLGTGDDELARLGLQHRLWSDAAVAAWKRAGIGIGCRVLDVGCGPGFAAFDLAQLVTPTGRIIGIDESPAFIQHLNAQAVARGLNHLSGLAADVQALGDIADGPFDAAYARWVLCFTPRPEDVVAGAARNLRSGGRLVIHDYFNYTTMTPAPRCASHDVLVKATADSWRARGGDPDIAGRLPAILQHCGFRVLELNVHQRIARGGLRDGRHIDPMLAWPLTWWRTYAPKLVAMGLITQPQCDEALRDLDALETNENAFFACPPVYEIIAQR